MPLYQCTAVLPRAVYGSVLYGSGTAYPPLNVHAMIPKSSIQPWVDKNILHILSWLYVDLAAVFQLLLYAFLATIRRGLRLPILLLAEQKLLPTPGKSL